MNENHFQEGLRPEEFMQGVPVDPEAKARDLALLADLPLSPQWLVEGTLRAIERVEKGTSAAFARDENHGPDSPFPGKQTKA